MSELENVDQVESTEPSPKVVALGAITRSQAARNYAVGTLDDDPDEAAKAIGLSQTTGVPSQIIATDVDNFVANQKALITAHIVKGNPYIQEYINSHPLNAKVSNDDYDNLDKLSEGLVKFNRGNTISQWFDSDSGSRATGQIMHQITEGAKIGFGDRPLGEMFVKDGFKPTGSAAADVYFKLSEAVARAETSIPELGLRAIGAGLMGTAYGVGEVFDQIFKGKQGKETAKVAVEALMDPGFQATVEGIGPPGVIAAGVLHALSRTHPDVLFKARADQAKVDAKDLKALEGDAASTNTVARAPEALADFVRIHGDANIEIPADVVRRLYGGDEGSRIAAEADDGKLGFVKNLSEQMEAAEATGGNISIPIKDWLARTPKDADDLRDDIIVRHGGISINDAKEAAETLEAKKATAEGEIAQGPIGEPLPMARDAAGLEPLYSIGDRKLTLEKADIKASLMDDPSIPADHFNLMDENGLRRGFVRVVPFDGGKKLYVDNISGMKGANMFGNHLIMDIARQLKEQYPDSEQIGGFRISGAREKAGTEREVWIKFDDLAGPEGYDHVTDLRDILSEKQIDVGKAGVLHYSDILKPHQAEADKLIRELLARVAPDAKVFTPTAITVPGRADIQRQGFMQTFRNQNPWIVVALDGLDRAGVARHEAVHYLRQFGFFKDDEWFNLVRAAKENDWIGKYKIEERYGDLTQSQKLEEAIAEGYRDWANGLETPKYLHPIFERLKEFFDQLKTGLREILGREPTWQEVFEKVESGEVGAREPTGHAGGAFLEPSAMDEPKPLFKTPGAIGMSAKEAASSERRMQEQQARDIAWEKDEAERDFKRTQTAEWKANRDTERAEVQANIANKPVVMADRFLTSGELFGQKLKREKLDVSKLSEEQKAALPREFYSKDGIDPNILANTIGYTSADRMVEDLVAYQEGKKQSGMSSKAFATRLIDSETDRRMAAKYGNLEDNIADRLKDHLLSVGEINRIAEETLEAGLRAGTEAPIDKATFTAGAKDVFNRQTVGSISTDRYFRDSGKITRRLEQAEREGKSAEAYRLAQSRWAATIMAGEAAKVEKAEKAVGKMAKRFKKTIVEGVDQGYTNSIQYILSKIGMYKDITYLKERMDRMHEDTFAKFIDARESDVGSELPIPDFLLDPSFQKPVDELTADQFMQVKTALDALQHLGREANKIEVAGAKADRATLIGEMVQKIMTFPLKVYHANEASLWISLPRQAIVALTSNLTLMRRLDRRDPFGVFHRTLIYPLSEAANGFDILRREIAGKLKELGKVKDDDTLVEPPPMLLDPTKKDAANPDGKPFTRFTKGNVRTMLQNAGNDGNWNVFAHGYNADPVALKEWLWKNVDEEMLRRAQSHGDIFTWLIGKADTVYEHLTGVPIRKIPLLDIVTGVKDANGKDITVPGWYHPLIKDAVREGGTKIEGVYDSNNFHTSLANGYTKSRTGKVYPISLDLNTSNARMLQMAKDISFKEVVTNVQKIYKDKDFREAITNHYGKDYTDSLMPYLKGVVGGMDSGGPLMQAATRVSETLRQNVMTTQIGYNVYTALKHGPTAFFLSGRRAGYGNLLNAINDLYNPLIDPDIRQANHDFIAKNAEEVNRRERHYQETIGGQEKLLTGESTWREFMIENSAWLVAQSDKASAKPLWLAAYRMAQDEIARKTGEDNHGLAKDMANQEVRLAHGSTAITNQPGIVQGAGPLHGWMVTFYGFFGTIMQRRIELAHDVADMYRLGKEGEFKKAMSMLPEFTKDFVTHVVLPIAIEEWVTSQVTEDKRGLGQKAWEIPLQGLAASIPYLRDFIHAAITGHKPEMGLLNTPFVDGAKIIEDVKAGKKMFSREHAGRLVEDAVTFAGDVTGRFPKELGHLARAGVDYSTGQQRPKSWDDWRMLATRGKIKRPEIK